MRVAGVAAISTALACVAAGCRSEGRGLADADPAYKVPAIKNAAVTDRVSAAPQLVASLDDEDAAVRFYAVEALRRLTGRTYDYHYYEDADARRPAVDRWKQWLATHQSTGDTNGDGKR